MHVFFLKNFKSFSKLHLKLVLSYSEILSRRAFLQFSETIRITFNIFFSVFSYLFIAFHIAILTDYFFHMWYVAPFGTIVQFKKREKHPWRSANFGNFTKINNPPWVFFTFFKLYKWYRIAQRISYYRCLSLHYY